jgi:rhamnogalacturonyl hydrolase YesR
MTSRQLNSTGQSRQLLFQSIQKLSRWLEKNDYKGYDTFDGLDSPILRPFTFNNKFLRIALQQSVRRSIVNVRPVLGIRKSRSTKGMGFIARGFLRLYQTTGDTSWLDKAQTTLAWLMENTSPGYSGACWGNHFDYQSRTGYAKKGLPSVVWTSLIGHAFLDAYEILGEKRFLDVTTSACDHILRDLAAFPEGEEAICIGYFPGSPSKVHNASTLGAGLLARNFSHTSNEAYRSHAEKAIRYTARHQRIDGSWYYGEAPNLHWIDNFHTGYVLDCLKYYSQGTRDTQFDGALKMGYDYWKETFFLSDGTPKYYDHKILPLDIQCCSQAIDTLVFFHEQDPDNLDLAIRVAKWTIDNMQDRSGYFYYRRYSRWLVNTTPTLHWGQATMLSALAGLYKLL